MIKTAFYIAIASLLFLFACQKKNEVGIQATYTGNPMVNFNNYTDDNGNFGYHKVDLNLKDSFININVEIKLTNTTATAPNDISIYLMKVDALVSDYNTKNGTTLEPVSNATGAIDFDFSKPVILKQGTRSVTIPLKVNALKLDLNKQNAIGIAIARVEGAELNAGPESKLVVELGTRNKYDGIYRLYGGFSRSDQPTYTGVSNSPRGYYEDYYLITSGSNSVDPSIILPTGLLGNTQLIYDGATGYVYFSGVAPRLTIGASNNVTVSAGNAIVPPSTAFTQTTAELAASKFYPTGISPAPNSFMSGKQTIVAHFRWSSGGIDRVTKDTFVYKGPR